MKTSTAKQSLPGIVNLSRKIEKELRSGKLDAWVIVRVTGNNYEAQVGYALDAEKRIGIAIERVKAAI